MPGNTVAADSSPRRRVVAKALSPRGFVAAKARRRAIGARFTQT
jgi:hypothetical protein